jgi:anti-sigma B factor antagonist
VVTLGGDHDVASRDAIADAFSVAGTGRDLLVDLSECTFIDSSVIGVLLACAQRLRGAGHRLELVVPADNEAIVRVLEIVDIASLVTVHERRP